MRSRMASEHQLTSEFAPIHFIFYNRIPFFFSLMVVVVFSTHQDLQQKHRLSPSALISGHHSWHGSLQKQIDQLTFKVYMKSIDFQLNFILFVPLFKISKHPPLSWSKSRIFGVYDGEVSPFRRYYTYAITSVIT